MSFTWTQIVDAFIEHEHAVGTDRGQAGPSVAFGLRDADGNAGGYIRVWGPSADRHRDNECYVLIARYNGAITLRDALGTVRHSEPLQRTLHIFDHPAGYTSGPPPAWNDRVITPKFMGTNSGYATPTELVVDVVQSFGTAGLHW
jgi:hypothetical protein